MQVVNLPALPAADAQLSGGDALVAKVALFKVARPPPHTDTILLFIYSQKLFSLVLRFRRFKVRRFSPS